MKVSNRIFYSLLAALGTLFFFGCAGSGSYSSLSTSYLSADGTVRTADGQPYRPTGRKSSRSSATAKTAAAPEYWWRDTNAQGSPSILVRLDEQKAYFKRGETIVGMTPISSGREGYSTPAGNFRVTQKNKNHVSNLYGDYVDASGVVVVENVGVHRDRRPAGTRFQGAAMPYFLRINGPVGLHAGYLPGYPASHGCIRLPMEMAQHFFHNAPSGTPVVVVR